MNYTEEFHKTIFQAESFSSAKTFILKNDHPKKMKVFPSEISDTMVKQYIERIKLQTKDKDFVAYIPDIIEKATLQVLPAKEVSLWTTILEARENLSIVNNNEIVVTDYNEDGNIILVEIDFGEKERLFLLTRYQRVAAWYRNSMRFKKRQDGKFVQEDGEVLALTPFVDVVIYKDRCYIINELNFNKIFKYDEVIKKQVETHKDEIVSLDFIGDSKAFYDLLDKSKREKQAMAKVILQKRISKIKEYKPRYIREQIECQKQLSFIQFNDNDAIIVDGKSFKAIVDILRGKINIDLITKELNGIEENE